MKEKGTPRRIALVDTFYSVTTSYPKDHQPSVAVMCGNVTGRYFPDSGEIEYKARFILILCLRHGLKGKRITPSQFEQEGGMGYSRKWKRSIKCQVGHGKRSMPLGKWMEQNNKFSDSRESVIEDVDEENETSESLQETKVLPRRKLLEQGLKSGSEKPVFYLKDGEMNVELPKVLKPVRNSKNKRVLDYSKMNSTEFRHEMIHDPDHILRLKLLEESYPLVSNDSSKKAEPSTIGYKRMKTSAGEESSLLKKEKVIEKDELDSEPSVEDLPVLNFVETNGCKISIKGLREEVANAGGFEAVNAFQRWDEIATALGVMVDAEPIGNQLKHIYETYFFDMEIGGEKTKL